MEKVIRIKHLCSYYMIAILSSNYFVDVEITHE